MHLRKTGKMKFSISGKCSFPSVSAFNICLFQLVLYIPSPLDLQGSVGDSSTCFFCLYLFLFYSGFRNVQHCLIHSEILFVSWMYMDQILDQLEHLLTFFFFFFFSFFINLACWRVSCLMPYLTAQFLGCNSHLGHVRELPVAWGLQIGHSVHTNPSSLIARHFSSIYNVSKNLVILQKFI